MAARYLADYAQGFPGGYREDYHPRIAVNDIQRIERARETGRLALHLYQPIIDSGDKVHVRLYSLGRPVPLSQAIPVLEHMGLRVFGEQVITEVAPVQLPNDRLRIRLRLQRVIDLTHAEFAKVQVW